MADPAPDSISNETTSSRRIMPKILLGSDAIPDRRAAQ
jgi:hypothetical protein